MVRRKRRSLLALALIVFIFYTVYVTVDYRFHEASHQKPAGLQRELFSLKSESDMSVWSFSEILTCPKFSIHDYPQTREAIFLQCDSKPPRVVSRASNSSNDIFEMPFGHKCLKDAIDSSCRDSRLVPSVVHYIWYNSTRMKFLPFLSFMSAVKFVKPCLILLHGPYLPYGSYWDYFVRVFPRIIHVKRNLPMTFGKNKMAYPEHGSDVMRIEALQAYGGLYLDWDEVVLRSVDKFRDYNMTMGLESAFYYQMGSQFIMSKPGAAFLELWYRSYSEDYKPKWTYNALKVPFRLAQKHPNLIHVADNLFCRPDWYGRKYIFNSNYNWSINYAMHLYSRYYKRPLDEGRIGLLNTTLGSVSRHILFGNKELCK